MLEFLFTMARVIIRVNYLDFLKYIVNCSQGCAFKQVLQNNTLRTKYLFYSFYAPVNGLLTYSRKDKFTY